MGHVIFFAHFILERLGETSEAHRLGLYKVADQDIEEEFYEWLVNHCNAFEKDFECTPVITDCRIISRGF